MDFTILIPHYRNGRITAYSISQFLKHTGRHNVEIIVVDNSYPDDSIEHLKPFEDKITIVPNTSDKISSHGIAYDMVVPMVKTEYFITAESDSFPTADNWLNYYEVLIACGYQMGGSVLKLSGGEYLHPAGAFYKKTIWEQCREYCDSLEYTYFPNLGMKEGFQCHLMVHDRVLNDFVQHPEKFIEVSSGYSDHTPWKMIERAEHYSPVVGPFHNGMGNLQESIKTYGDRNIQKDAPFAILDNKEDLIYRIGYEPGQYLCYWAIATGKQIYSIPTRIQWLPKRDYQQQEYTIMENGFKHIWGTSSYYKGNNPDMQDVIDFKEKQVQELYDSMPDKYKIPARKDEDLITNP
jgi:hypothetical protein